MARKRKYNKEIISKACEGCTTYVQVLENLGLKPTGGNYRSLKKYIRYYEVDVSEFKGQGWSKGQTTDTNLSIKKQAKSISTPNEEVFKEKSFYTNSRGLRRKMIEEGFKYECSECELTEWRGSDITLHIDHINGVNSDNRKENLRFLCPNCHQQTPTWGNKSE